MSWDLAIRATEVLLAWAYLVQSIEHLAGGRRDQLIFGPRIVLAILLMLGIGTPFVLLGLLVLAVAALHRFQGPYNGGADKMGLLVLLCLTGAHWAPTTQIRELIFGYLALQLVLSYFLSGWVKIKNSRWRNGQALHNVFSFSAYPVSERLRGFAQWPKLLFAMSWAVMLFEVIFPLTLLHPLSLVAGLGVAALFHLANACLFGLNRFFWVWLAAYPSILWFQARFLSFS